MKDVFKSISNSVIIMSILSIVIGVIFIAYPGATLSALGIAVGVCMIIYGAALIVLDVRAWSLYIPFSGLIRGILALLLGVLLLVYPSQISVFIGVYLGVWIIISAIDNIRLAASLKGSGAPWVLMIILDIVDIIVGCFAVMMPVIASESMTMALGFVLIVHAVINIVDMISVKRNARELEKLIKERF